MHCIRHTVRKKVRSAAPVLKSSSPASERVQKYYTPTWQNIKMLIKRFAFHTGGVVSRANNKQKGRSHLQFQPFLQQCWWHCHFTTFLPQPNPFLFFRWAVSLHWRLPVGSLVSTSVASVVKKVLEDMAVTSAKFRVQFCRRFVDNAFVIQGRQHVEPFYHVLNSITHFQFSK